MGQEYDAENEWNRQRAGSVAARNVGIEDEPQRPLSIALDEAHKQLCEALGLANEILNRLRGPQPMLADVAETAKHPNISEQAHRNIYAAQSLNRLLTELRDRL